MAKKYLSNLILYLDLNDLYIIYFINNTLFVFRELIRKLNLKMKLRHVHDQNQKFYQARKIVWKH